MTGQARRSWMTTGARDDNRYGLDGQALNRKRNEICSGGYKRANETMAMLTVIS